MKNLLKLVLIILGLVAATGVLPAHARERADYVVQPGDTLTGIATRHGVSVRQGIH